MNTSNGDSAETVADSLVQYKLLHQSKSDYGSGSRHFDYACLAIQFGGFKTALDYGCGKGVLADQLNRNQIVQCDKFDPAIPGLDKLQSQRYDVIVSTDVFEHIPESALSDVLKEFGKISDSAIIIPHLKPARQILPNGENAHCTLKSPDEWQALFQNYYNTVLILDHESDRHAFLFCTNKHLNSAAIQLASKYLADSRPLAREVRAFIDDPFLHRLKKAIKLLGGASLTSFANWLKKWKSKPS